MLTLVLKDIHWFKIMAFVIMGLFYFVAFYKEESLLTEGEKENEKKLSKKLGGIVSGRVIWAIIGLLFVGISLLLSSF